MDRTTRQFYLRTAGLRENLLAVDPRGCGCTECILGEYIPYDKIPAELKPVYQRLIAKGVLRDNTYGDFMPRTVDGYDLIEAVFDALDDDGWTMHDVPLTMRDVRSIAEVAVRTVLDLQE